MGEVYADKGYCGKPNSGFFHMNGIADGIMRKGSRSTKLTEFLRDERLVDQGHVFQRSFDQMRKTLKSSTRIMVLLLAGGGLLLLTGCASVRAPAYLPHSYSTATAGLSPEMQSDFTTSPDVILRRFEKDGCLHLSLIGAYPVSGISSGPGGH